MLHLAVDGRPLGGQVASRQQASLRRQIAGLAKDMVLLVVRCRAKGRSDRPRCVAPEASSKSLAYAAVRWKDGEMERWRDGERVMM